MNHDPELRELESSAIAQILREELAHRRISRQALADMARISLSTLEKALSGSRPFTLATVVRIEDVLGKSLRRVRQTEPEPSQAPLEMGAYSRMAVRWIEGDYLTLRPGFGQAGTIYAYRTRVFWDEAAGHLRFTESERADSTFSQAGYVSMPHLSGHIYLVTSETGQYRLIILGRATREQRMYGLLATLQVGSGSQLVPSACPVALVPLGQVPEARFGVMAPGDPDEAEYRTILATALANDFCRWSQ